MAQRLATVYVKTSLILTEAEMSKFTQLFAEQQMNLQVKVLDNGNQELALEDDAAQDCILTFERVGNRYRFSGSCRITNPKLANAMRKAVAQFKGDAIVHRIYTGYTMVYHYEQGTAVQIIECKDGSEKLVYEYKDTLGSLQKLFDRIDVEAAIQVTHIEINDLLDERNACATEDEKSAIDLKLGALTQKLFALEAY
ncbi:non-ribosomal peptide synthetase module [Paenibacillus gansuensis]|uniref:Non-ribosomal peptide synthetase module n=1 Tax=Paenibacillus gansuensis TaxID=306542 RepID=A0ABW5PC49_9BACL